MSRQKAKQADREYFAEWLTITLGNMDLSGGEVARATGVTEAAVSRWRNGHGRPSLESCMKLAVLLKVHAIRLAVTAGHMTPEEAGVGRLPLPADTGRLSAIESQIKRIPGLTAEEEEALLKTLHDRRVLNDESTGEPNR